MQELGDQRQVGLAAVLQKVASGPLPAVAGTLRRKTTEGRTGPYPLGSGSCQASAMLLKSCWVPEGKGGGSITCLLGSVQGVRMSPERS